MTSQEAATHTQAAVRTQRHTDRRKGLMVEPGFQNGVRVKILGMAFAVAATTLGLSKIVSYLVGHPSLFDNPMVPLLLAATPLVLCGAIVRVCDRISNRVAGPAYRVRCALEAVQRNERPDPIRLREGDEFQDLAAALNATLQQLGAMDTPRD